MSGARFSAALLVIAILAAVLPSAGAVWVNRSRVTRAQGDMRRAGDALCGSRPWLSSLLSADPSAAQAPARVVLIGSGNLPKVNAASAWLTTGAHSLLRLPMGTGSSDSAEMKPDPWGNSYVAVLLKVDGKQPGTEARGWILTAGPNGIVETTFDRIDGPEVLGGDDLTVRVCEFPRPPA